MSSSFLSTIHLLQELPTEFERSLFVYTSQKCLDEVQRALQHTINLKTAVFLPKNGNQKVYPNTTDAIDWENNAISISDVIMFWLPDAISDEELAQCSACFGKWASSGKVIYGRDTSTVSSKNSAKPSATGEVRRFGYMDNLAKREGVQKHSSIDDCLTEFLKKTKDGAIRRAGERYVPLHVYKHVAFSNWYAGMQKVGNRLDHATFEWAFRVGPNKAFTLFWVLHVNVWVKSEQRNKSNEIVLARGDIKCVFPYYIPKVRGFRKLTAMDCEIVLIKEFRSPARTEDCFIHELPGGSAFKAKDPIQEAIDELRQETGLDIDAKNPEQRGRIIDHGARQLAGTTSAHQAHLFSVELTANEMRHCRAQAKSGKPLGNAQETEMTYVEVYKLKDIIKSNVIDWTTLGMLHLVLHEAVERKATAKKNRSDWSLLECFW